MAQPPPYNRLANYTEYATGNPSAPYNAADHDAEHNAIETTLDAALSNLSQVQRDDGRLANASVHPDALNSATLALLASATWTPRGNWVTATLYAVGDVVEESAQSYVCAVAHTSGTFATDHTAGKWVILNGVTSLPASSVTFTPAGSIAAGTVQLAIQELDTEKAALAGSASQTFSVADGTDDQHALARRQVQNNSLFHIVGGGTGDAITGTLATGGVVALADGMEFSVRSPGANTIDLPTFNLTLDATATGAIEILRGDTLTRLLQSDIGVAGHELRLKYRSSPSNWLLINPLNAINGAEYAVIEDNFTQNPWQHNPPVAVGAGTAVYTADMWQLSLAGAAAASVLKTADAPPIAQVGIYVTHCLHVDVTTADASIAAGDFAVLIRPVEGVDMAPFGFGQAGTRYATLSFSVKSPKSGIHCVSFRNSANTRTYVAEYTVSSANTFERKVITIPVDTTGTWLYDIGVGLRVGFALAAGSTTQTTAGAWQAGNFLATANQVNCVDSTSNDFKLDCVKLQLGQYATRFVGREQAALRSFCERYFQSTQNLRATNTGAGAADVKITWQFRTRMRATPTVMLDTGATEIATVFGVTCVQNIAAGATYDTSSIRASAEL